MSGWPSNNTMPKIKPPGNRFANVREDVVHTNLLEIDEVADQAGAANNEDNSKEECNTEVGKNGDAEVNYKENTNEEDKKALTSTRNKRCCDLITTIQAKHLGRSTLLVTVWWSKQHLSWNGKALGLV
jgi:hypothetical protein